MRATSSKPSLVVVLYANPDHYPPTWGAIRLLSAWFRVRVICRRNADPKEIEWPEGVRVDRIGEATSEAVKFAAPAHEKLREYLGFAWAVRRAIAEERPRLIYAYEPHAYVAALLSRPRCALVYHRHEIEEPGDRRARSLGGVILQAALRFTRRADLVVFPEAGRARVYLAEAGDPRPPRIVPNYPLLEAFPRPAALPDLLARRLADRTVYYRGAIGDNAAIPEAVGALTHLPREVRLALRGPVAPAYAAKIAGLAAELGVEDRLRNGGYLPSFAAVNEETREASVGLVLYKPVVQNLRFIGSATNKLWEYAACALPVVASEGETFREVLAGEPWAAFADPRDPRAIAGAVSSLIGDPARYAELAAAARRAFEERFHFEAAFAPLGADVRRLAGITADP